MSQTTERPPFRNSPYVFSYASAHEGGPTFCGMIRRNLKGTWLVPVGPDKFRYVKALRYRPARHD